MEKYSRFADASTGLNPFVPSWIGRPQRHIGVRVLTSIAFFPIFLLRVTLALFALVLLLLAHGLGLCVFMCPRLRRSLLLVLTAPSLRILLTCLGIRLQTVHADARRLKLRPRRDPHHVEHGTVARLSHGDVVFSNYTGLVEVLYLTYLYRPMFVHIHHHTLSLVSPWRMALQSLRHAPPAQPHHGRTFRSLDTLADVCREQGLGPVVVFPEGQKSNGRVLLAWQKEALAPSGPAATFRTFLSTRCVIVAFQYGTDAAYTPPHTVYSGTFHLLRLAYEPGNHVTLVWTTKAQITELLSQCPEQAQPHDLLAVLREGMKQLAPGLQLVSVDGRRQHEFAAYFEATQASKYKRE